MAEQTTTHRRNSKIGYVVSNKMSKTIIVEVDRQKAHPVYRRVIKSSKKFYAHDENGMAHVGDVVRIEETRPLSKLKRWRLTDVIQRAALVPAHADEPVREHPVLPARCVDPVRYARVDTRDDETDAAVAVDVDLGLVQRGLARREVARVEPLAAVRDPVPVVGVGHVGRDEQSLVGGE